VNSCITLLTEDAAARPTYAGIQGPDGNCVPPLPLAGRRCPVWPRIDASSSNRCDIDARQPGS